MAVKQVKADEAAALMREGYVYLDVRSVPEFEAGHPAGAYNVPLVHRGPGGMSPNPAFVSTVRSAFAPETRIVVGCQMGGRSARAAAVLEAEGYTALVDQHEGFDGAPGAGPGWRRRGLEVATGPEVGRSWTDLERGPR